MSGYHCKAHACEADEFSSRYGAIRRKRESMAVRASRRESMATVRINDDGEVEDVNAEEEPVSLARRLLLGKSR